MIGIEAISGRPDKLVKVGEKLFMGGCAFIGATPDVMLLNGPWKDFLITGAAFAVGSLACLGRERHVSPPTDPTREPLPIDSLHVLPSLPALENELADLKHAA